MFLFCHLSLATYNYAAVKRLQTVHFFYMIKFQVLSLKRKEDSGKKRTLNLVVGVLYHTNMGVNMFTI